MYHKSAVDAFGKHIAGRKGQVSFVDSLKNGPIKVRQIGCPSTCMVVAVRGCELESALSRVMG